MIHIFWVLSWHWSRWPKKWLKGSKVVPMTLNIERRDAQSNLRACLGTVCDQLLHSFLASYVTWWFTSCIVRLRKQTQTRKPSEAQAACHVPHWRRYYYNSPPPTLLLDFQNSNTFYRPHTSSALTQPFKPRIHTSRSPPTWRTEPHEDGHLPATTSTSPTHTSPPTLPPKPRRQKQKSGHWADSSTTWARS